MGAALKAPAWRRQRPEGLVADKTLKATLMKSPIGAKPEIKATVESLGFRRMNQTR